MPVLSSSVRTCSRTITAEGGNFEEHPTGFRMRGFASAYTDDITIIISNISEIEVVGIVLRGYEVVTRNRCACGSAAREAGQCQLTVLYNVGVKDRLNCLRFGLVQTIGWTITEGL